MVRRLVRALHTDSTRVHTTHNTKDPFTLGNRIDLQFVQQLQGEYLSCKVRYIPFKSISGRYSPAGDVKYRLRSKSRPTVCIVVDLGANPELPITKAFKTSLLPQASRYANTEFLMLLYSWTRAPWRKKLIERPAT